MMQVALRRSLLEAFEIAAALKRDDLLHREMMNTLHLKTRAARAEDRLREERFEREAAIVQAMFAPAEKVEAFRARLDLYDTASVEALMVNREALDAVHERLGIMLAKAHVLEDGRRVFKTIDGQKVVDEHGRELTTGTVDPQTIADTKPRWEHFKGALDERERLTKERETLIDYQGKLDQARARLDKGEITEGELKDMGERLKVDMPEAVRVIQERQSARNDAAPARDTAAPALPSDMDKLMRQTGLSSVSIAPI